MNMPKGAIDIDHKDNNRFSEAIYVLWMVS